MPEIQHGPRATEKLVVDPSALQKAKQVEEERINRGYDTENSVSTLTEQDDDQAPKAQHRIDPPAEGADTPSEKVLREIAVFKEIQDAFNAKQATPGDALLGELVLEKVDQKFFDGALGRQNPLARDISALQSNKDHLLSLGYSEALIEGLLSLADPNDPDNSLASMHSFSTRVAGKLGGDDSLEKLHTLFGDTLSRVANLKGGPADLHTQLQADLKAFNAAFLDSKKHIDVDSATLMLMQIQTQLQNNRLVFDQQNIKISQVAREQISEKRMNKILDSIEKAKEAKKAGVVSKIFGGIAVAIMAVVAAVMIAGAIFTGGASAVAAAGLMVAATALVVTMMVSAETGNWMMEIFGDSQESQLGAMIFWSVLIMAMTLGAGAITGAAGNAAATANAAGAGAATGAGGASVTASATTAATVAARTARLAAMASRFSKVMRWIAGAAMVGDGAASAVSTKLQYDADMLRAEAKELYAWMLHNQHVIDDLIEDIQKVIEELQQGFSSIASILKDNHDTKTRQIGLIKG